MTEVTSKKHYIKFEQNSLLLASFNLKLKKENSKDTIS